MRRASQKLECGGSHRARRGSRAGSAGIDSGRTSWLHSCAASHIIALIKMRGAKPHEQLAFDLQPRTRGGKRAGAGRKKTGRCSDAPHRTRPRVRRYEVQHVVLRTRKDVPRLRRGKTYTAIARALRRTLAKTTFRVVHTSIQRNHLHFLVEANDRAALSHGMRALAITAARAINRVLGRTGKVFAFRYHATAIASPRQMRNALSYVLNNWRRHDEDESCEAAHRATLDPYSTAF